MEKAMLSTGKDDWETPEDLFKKLDEEFHFTLDPCSSHENAKCKKHYTKKRRWTITKLERGDCVLQSSIQCKGEAG